jgi:MraZ protein
VDKYVEIVENLKIMLIGEFRHNLDQKGRLAIPAKFKNTFAEGLVITRGLDNCLFVFPKREWEKVVEKLTKLPLSQKDSRAFMRFLLSGAYESDLDNQGRLLIPEYLRNYAQLKKRVVIIGLYTRLEVWDEKLWEEYEKEREEQAQEIAERLSDLGI